MQPIKITMFATICAVLFAVGCGDDDNVVGPTWEENQQFVVETTRRMAMSAEETIPYVDMDGMEISTDPLNETWTDPVYWTYTVTHAGYEPDEGDELRPYFELGGRQSALTVLRAHLDPNHNWGHPMLEADPRVYLVVREDRNRVAAVVTFHTVGDTRVREAFDLSDTDSATNLLSQSDLAAAPTYLPPFPMRDEDATVVMENGNEMHTYSEGDGVTDVIFTDEMDGNLVHQRWETGNPFPTETVTPNLEAALLSEGEVDLLSQGVPRADLPDPGSEDWDFLDALRDTVDLKAALAITSDDIGSTDAKAVDGYLPWAGSWWPQSKGDLVFGYDYRATFSDEIKGDIDPICTDIDNLSDEMRDLRKNSGSSSDEYKTKVDEYKAKQKDLVNKLVEFYGGMLSGLDGGQITVESGQIKKGEEWSYSLDELSPFDKWALYEYLGGNTNPNPFYLPAWELLNHYSPAGGSWWGHCNGWAATAILSNEPRASMTQEVASHSFTFTTADLKGLLTESYYSQQSHFYGERYNGDEQDIADLHPDAFHRIIDFYIADRGVPLVFDTSAGDAVWNYPAYSYEMLIEETTSDTALVLVNLNTADRDTLMDLPEIGESKADKIIDYRLANGPLQTVEEITEIDGIGDGTLDAIRPLVTVDPLERTFDVLVDLVFTTDAVDEDWVDFDSPEGFTNNYSYKLIADENGLVTRGTWDDENTHPDFAWVPYSNPRYPSNNGSENPYLNFGNLADMIGPDAIRQ